jgi:hypothetical protein
MFLFLSSFIERAPQSAIRALGYEPSTELLRRREGEVLGGGDRADDESPGALPGMPGTFVRRIPSRRAQGRQ